MPKQDMNPVRNFLILDKKADISNGVNPRGVALIIVLVLILAVVILANIALVLISSQFRLTHHQVGRVQAFYVAQAGVNYALEQLRTGAWTFSPVNSCPHPNGCLINDPNFPNSIISFDGTTNRQFRVIFCPAGTTCASTSVPCNPPGGINFCINATATYTSAP